MNLVQEPLSALLDGQAVIHRDIVVILPIVQQEVSRYGGCLVLRLIRYIADFPHDYANGLIDPERDITVPVNRGNEIYDSLGGLIRQNLPHHVGWVSHGGHLLHGTDRDFNVVRRDLR